MKTFNITLGDKDKIRKSVFVAKTQFFPQFLWVSHPSNNKQSASSGEV